MTPGPQQLTDGAVAVTSGVALAPFAAMFPEHWPILVISGVVAGLLRVMRILRLKKPGRVYDAFSAMLASLASAFVFWPAMASKFEPTFGTFEMGPVTAMWFGSFMAGLIGSTLIGAILDWRAPVVSRGDKNDP